MELDNLFCDGEVSVDWHSWSNSAYATDCNEKLWPVTYGGHSKAGESAAYIPGAGHMWDLAQKKGLTYRSYGEYATRASTGTSMEASPGVGGLLGHVAPKFKLPGMPRSKLANAQVPKESSGRKPAGGPIPWTSRRTSAHPARTEDCRRRRWL